MKKTRKYLLCLLTLALMLFLPAAAAQAASGQQPGYVSSITAKVSDNNKVTVTWKKAKNATSYRVYYKQAGGKWKTLANVKGTKYTHTSSRKYPLTEGKKYAYTVKAYNRYGRKWGSYDRNGKTVTIPAIPGKVNVTKVKANSYQEVQVNWSKAKNATSYHVYYKEAGARNWRKIDSVSGRYTSFKHRSSKAFPLKPDKKYVYTVKAYNGNFKKWGSYNTKGWSVSVPKKPAAKPTATPVPEKIPGTVNTCRVYAKSYDEVAIIWEKVENATSYAVFYKEADTNAWKKITTIKNNATNYIHKSFSIYSLEPGETYVYTIRAYNDDSEKWGGYNTKGWSVTMPEKPAPTAAPTETPEPTGTPEKPTVTPQPTNTPVPTATPTPKPTQPDENKKAEEYAKEVIRLTNIERKKEGLSELKYHEKMQNAAMVRAKELVQRYDGTHQRPDGRASETAMYEAGVGNPGRENIGKGRTSPQGIVNAWMSSDGHKNTILQRDYTHIGVGYYCDSEGMGYWVQEFSSNPDAKCTLTVDGNGGTFPSKGVEKYSMELPQGMTLETDDFEKPVKVGCVFEKWTTVLSFGWESGATSEVHMSDDKTLKANWVDGSSSTQSIFTDNASSSVTTSTTENLFSDGTTDKNSSSDINTNSDSSEITSTNIDINNDEDIDYEDPDTEIVSTEN